MLITGTAAHRKPMLVVWFRYKEGYLAKEDRFVDKPLPGFYAEDVFRAFPECAMQNPDTSVEDWNYRSEFLYR